jgi:hypothetical protein
MTMAIGKYKYQCGEFMTPDLFDYRVEN